MASKQAKEKKSQNRVNSASKNEAASIAASVVGGAQENKKQKLIIWPEWNDADVNSEKWDTPHKAKEKEKGKSPSSMQHFFDDPEGRIEMPPSLRQRVDHWKRPQEYMIDKTPVISDLDRGHEFDLLSPNEHIHDCEIIRWIIAQITDLYRITMQTNDNTDLSNTMMLNAGDKHAWKPWDHVFSLCRVGKGPHQPQYNPHGKYIIKLYWLGCWRKITIDDSIPFDDNGKMLLPGTRLQQELWPMLLAKGLIKLMSLDYASGNSSCEFNDVSVIHALTGWLPETIPLQYGHLDRVWGLLKKLLPEFKLPEVTEHPGTPESEVIKKDVKIDDTASTKDGSKKEEKTGREKEGKSEKSDKEGKPGKEGKEHKEDKKDKKEKDKDKEKRSQSAAGGRGDKEPATPSVPDTPQVAIFVSYVHPPKIPVRISVLGEMADASERLRQTGMSHTFPHPLLITQTRSCPLVAPPPPPKIPAWKLIRPKKKKVSPSDEPTEPEPHKPEQFVELTSPYVNYKVSPIPIPTETKRPKSTLSRGGSRPNTSMMLEINEDDENAPEKTEDQMKTEAEEAAAGLESQSEMKPPPEIISPAPPSSPKERRKSGLKREKSALAKSTLDKESVKEPEKKEPGSPTRKKSAKKRGQATLEKPTVKVEGQKSTKPEGDKADKASKGGFPVGIESSSLKPGDADVDALSVISDINKPPGDTTPGIDGEGGHDTPKCEELPALDNVPKDIWMDFEHFCKCFKTLYIFHKPQTYTCNHKMSDLKTNQPASKKSAAPGGPNPSSSMTSQTPARIPFSPSPQHHPDREKMSLDDRAPHYLFVDNLENTEIIVSFSSLSKWLDSAIEPPKTSHSSTKDRHRDTESIAGSSSMGEVAAPSQKEMPVMPLIPGLLVAEPYSWKSLVVGQPILRIRTTSTRAAALTLPPGRHVLRFMMNAPLGYHVHLCSTVQFVYGEEEHVMSCLTKESCRFIDHAMQIMKAIHHVVINYDVQEELQVALGKLGDTHCPKRKAILAKAHNYDEDILDKLKPVYPIVHNYQVFTEALYTMLRKALGENFLPEMAFGWKSLHMDANVKNVTGQIWATSRPATGASRKSAKTSRKKEVPESWLNRSPTDEETKAVTKLTSHWRGTYVRKLRKARISGTKENLFAKEQLLKAWGLLEPNLEQNALILFRSMFKVDPNLMPDFPFYQDEWNRIAYTDYQGTYQEQPANTWFVVFREVFYVSEPMLVVPKLYVSVPTCMLRVVDNDTGEEIPRIFQRVAPYEYTKNKRGYTFVAEARTVDLPLPSSKWRMRLIGSNTPLPQPMRDSLNSSFSVKEIRDYYIPNKDHTILRYTLKPTEDHISSIQFSTSKPDVYISLQILDNEEEVACVLGKGHAVIPAFTFLRDRDPGEDERRSGSRTSLRGIVRHISSANLTSSGKRRQSSAGSGRGSRGSRGSSAKLDPELDEQEMKPHKYTIQVKVLRKSWPLSESSWAFVQVLRDLERNELKAVKDRPSSPEKEGSKTSSKGEKGKKGKDKGKEKDKGANATSRPSSQQFDSTKAYWTLRIVLDQTPTEEVEVKRDTERQDEIRATKQAWEAAEPGRAAKAQGAREKFLKEHLIKLESSEDEDKAEEKADGEGEDIPASSEVEPPSSEAVLTNEPPPPKEPKEILKPIDLTPYLSPPDFTGTPRLKDAAEVEKQTRDQQRIRQQYKAFRESVLAEREEDKRIRNLTKDKQLQDAIQLQTELDERRLQLNEPREAFRQKFLEAERKRLEQLARAEAAMRAEQEKKSPSPKNNRKSPKGKKSPKKSGKKK